MECLANPVEFLRILENSNSWGTFGRIPVKISGLLLEEFLGNSRKKSLETPGEIAMEPQNNYWRNYRGIRGGIPD